MNSSSEGGVSTVFVPTVLVVENLVCHVNDGALLRRYITLVTMKSMKGKGSANLTISGSLASVDLVVRIVKAALVVHGGRRGSKVVATESEREVDSRYSHQSKNRGRASSTGGTATHPASSTLPESSGAATAALEAVWRRIRRALTTLNTKPTGLQFATLFNHSRQYMCISLSPSLSPHHVAAPALPLFCSLNSLFRRTLSLSRRTPLCISSRSLVCWRCTTATITATTVVAATSTAFGAILARRRTARSPWSTTALRYRDAKELAAGLCNPIPTPETPSVLQEVLNFDPPFSKNLVLDRAALDRSRASASPPPRSISIYTRRSTTTPQRSIDSSQESW